MRVILRQCWFNVGSLSATLDPRCLMGYGHLFVRAYSTQYGNVPMITQMRCDCMFWCICTRVADVDYFIIYPVYLTMPAIFRDAVRITHNVVNFIWHNVARTT